MSGLIDTRGKTHGDVEGNFRLIAELWSTLLGVELTGVDVAQCMIALKLARITSGDESHADHWDDIGGYSEIGKRLAKKPGT